MKKFSFALTMGAVVVATLGATALRYHLQSSVHPALIVYHDSVVLPSQDRPSNDTYWTLAIRSDGASMRANGAPDAAGRFDTVRDVEFKDRYVVIDPFTKSISTYKPYRPFMSAAHDCGGTGAGSFLAHPLQLVRDTTKSGKLLGERWLATDLDCIMLRQHIVDTTPDGKVANLYREAVLVKTGEPSSEFFEVPSGYQERGPAELNEAAAPGNKPFCNRESAEKLQKVYEAEKLR